MVSPSGMKNNTKCLIALVGAAIGRPNWDAAYRRWRAAYGRPYEKKLELVSLLTPNSSKSQFIYSIIRINHGKVKKLSP